MELKKQDLEPALAAKALHDLFATGTLAIDKKQIDDVHEMIKDPVILYEFEMRMGKVLADINNFKDYAAKYAYKELSKLG